MTLFYTTCLLILANCFMTAAWYGHLKYHHLSIWHAILISWIIAFFEYCLQVPANRLSYGAFSGYQLKILQECITLIVFIIFAWLYLGEDLNLRYGISIGLIGAAVAVAFYK